MKTFVFVLLTLAVVQAKYLQVGEPRPFYNATNAVRSIIGDNSQHLRCFDAPNQVGYYVDIGNEAVPDLSRSPYNFDNRIASCTFKGIYFMYDNYNFNPNFNVSYSYGDEETFKHLRQSLTGTSVCWDLGRQHECEHEWFCLQGFVSQTNWSPWWLQIWHTQLLPGRILSRSWAVLLQRCCLNQGWQLWNVRKLNRNFT